MKNEHNKAREWRKLRGLSIEQLAELSGYSIHAIYKMEQDRASRQGGGKITSWVWQRYRNVCAGIDAQIRSGVDFKWGE